MIRLDCPHCGEPLEFGDQASGSQVKCPGCRKAILLPNPSEVGDDSDAEVLGDVGSAERSFLGLPSALRTTLLIAGGCVFILASIAGIILLINIHRNPKPAQEVLGRLGGVLGDFVSSVSGLVLAVLLVVLFVGYIVFAVGMAAWVARDAHNRGHSGLGWAVFYLFWQIAAAACTVPLITLAGVPLVVLLFGWIGLSIYLGGRRQGRVVPCSRCPNKRLSFTACPHCGSGVLRRRRKEALA